MRRKSPAPTIDTFRLLDALRVHFSTFVIDHDEMEADGFEQAREIVDARVSRGAFRSKDDLPRHTGAYREFALTKVSDRAGGPNVAI